jgi:ADP-ribose pyrophosphatase YjhB (NUDIX family)
MTAVPGPRGVVVAEVQVALALLGVEGDELVLGLEREDAGSMIAFTFPTAAVVPGEQPDATARRLAGELVRNRVTSPRLLGVHLGGRTPQGDPTALVSFVAGCRGRPPRRRQEGSFDFGIVRKLRRKYPEFMEPHDQVLRNALGWLFHSVQHSPIAADMCGPRFTIAELRSVYEQVWGEDLDPANFHKQVTKPALEFVRKVEDFAGQGPGKPAALYERGQGRVLNPPVRPPHGKYVPPSVRVWGRDPRGRLTRSRARYDI